MKIAFKSNTYGNYEPEDHLKIIYKQFEIYEQIEFFILSEEKSEKNLLIESQIHRYCRAVGFANFKIFFKVKEKSNFDLIFPE
jgi:hypothetical protein